MRGLGGAANLRADRRWTLRSFSVGVATGYVGGRILAHLSRRARALERALPAAQAGSVGPLSALAAPTGSSAAP